MTVTINDVQVLLPVDPLPANTMLTGASVGVQTEDAVVRRAAIHLSPAFVFRVAKRVRRGGNGNREVGDGLILVGRRLLVLQVKGRVDGEADTPARAKSWLRKATKDAASQVSGTVRTLFAATGPIELRMVSPYEGLKDVTVVLEPGHIQEVVGLVIVDHPADPSGLSDLTPLVSPSATIPMARMRLDEWDYIVANCRMATDLLEHVFAAAATRDDYGKKREAFLAGPLGAPLRLIPVERVASTQPDQGTLLGAFQVPDAAMYSPRDHQLEHAWHQLFAATVFGLTYGLQPSFVLDTLALLDQFPLPERREAMQACEQARDELEPGQARVLTMSIGAVTLVQVIAKGGDEMLASLFGEARRHLTGATPGVRVVVVLWWRPAGRWTVQTVVP